MDTSKDFEKELLKSCILGKKSAWDYFVKKYTNLIYSSIHHCLRVNNFPYIQEDIKDIHNSIFLSLVENNYKKFRQFKGERGSSLSTWLWVIASRTTLNFIRSHRKGLPIENLLENGLDLLEDIPDSKPTPYEYLEKSEARRLLAKIIEKLSSEDQFLIELYYVKELAPERIARIMETTVTAIYKRLDRVKGKIKKIAQEENFLGKNS